EVQGERRCRPGRLSWRHLGQPEAGEPYGHVLRVAACLARALGDEIEATADDLGRDAETRDDAVGDPPGQPQRLRAVRGTDDPDPPLRPPEPTRAAFPLGPAVLEQPEERVDVRLELRKRRRPVPQVPGTGAAGAEADVDAPGREIVDAGGGRSGHDG